MWHRATLTYISHHYAAHVLSSLQLLVWQLCVRTPPLERPSPHPLLAWLLFRPLVTSQQHPPVPALSDCCRKATTRLQWLRGLHVDVAVVVASASSSLKAPRQLGHCHTVSTQKAECKIKMNMTVILANSIYSVCTLNIQPLHTQYTVSAHSIYSLWTLNIQSLHTQYTVSAHSIYSLCTLTNAVAGYLMQQLQPAALTCELWLFWPPWLQLLVSWMSSAQLHAW